MLDPEDWPAFRALAHAALDDALDYVQTVRDRPAWQPVPRGVAAALASPVPRQPRSLDDVYAEFKERIMPYAGGNIHPRFFGWVQGSGTPTGALADFLASVMNPNVGGRDHGAVYVERAVVSWFLEIFGFPTSGSGVLTMGTSAANLIAVLVARTRALGVSVRETGVNTGARLTAYASTETHGCLRRAFEVSGLGSASLRVLHADSSQRLDPDTLVRAIREDRAAGYLPFLVVGNAGTVDAGAIDPLDDIASIAAREGLWFHVDGAFGATAILATSVAPRLRGIERADSIAFDFHKWLHVPYDAGCLIVRDAALHRETFASSPSYLTRMPRGLAGGPPWFTDYTIDLSRSFRALKIWFTMQQFGTERLGEAIEKNLAQAQLLSRLVDEDDSFELLAPVQLNVVCFRYVPGGMPPDVVDRENDELVIRLQESGAAVTSSTTIAGKRAIRACIVNHRTTDADIHATFEAIRRLAQSR